MGLPKRRHSNTRTRLRRANDFLKVQGPSNCPQCGAPILSHRVCAKCGYYNGRQVVTPKVKEDKPKK